MLLVGFLTLNEGKKLMQIYEKKADMDKQQQQMLDLSEYTHKTHTGKTVEGWSAESSEYWKFLISWYLNSDAIKTNFESLLSHTSEWF